MPAKSACTREDVARHAGVSGATVSFVLNGRWREMRIAENTCRQVMKSIHALNYVPNRSARELRGQTTGRIALVVRGLFREYYLHAIEAIHAEAQARDCSLLLHFCNTCDDLVQVSRNAISHADALLIWGDSAPEPDKPWPHLDGIQSLAKPVVFVFPAVVSPQITSVDTVSNDMELGAYWAAIHLIEQGYTDIHLFARTPPRRLGLERALREKGLPLDPSRVHADAWHSYEHGAQAAERIPLRPDRSTAVIANNDAVAAGLMNALLRRGLWAGQDYGLAGFDDLPISPHLPVPLTTVAQPYRDVAKGVFDILDARATPDGKQQRAHLMFPPRLIVRASSQRSPA